MKRKFRLNDIVSKLTREEMKCICGGSGMGGFPVARCTVVCGNNSQSTVGSNTCPPITNACGNDTIIRCTCKD